MADIALSGGTWSYRKFTEASALEAIKRWDDGVRVANLAEFERSNLLSGGWTVVYTGTSRKASGGDVKLTTDFFKTVARAGFAMNSINVPPDDRGFFEGARDQILLSATTSLVSHGAGKAFGIIVGSAATGNVAGLALGFLLEFLSDVPSVGWANEVSLFLLCGGEMSEHLFVAPGRPVHVMVNIRPGAELSGVTLVAIDRRGSPVYERTVGFEDVKDLWGNSLAMISLDPFVTTQPGEYRFRAACGSGTGNARLSVKTPDVLPREYVLVVDVSASMVGDKLLVAKQLLLELTGQLRADDHFNLVYFSDRSSASFPQSRVATRLDVILAQNEIAAQQADGGTELSPALELAYSLPPASGKQRIVVLVTDGGDQPDRAVLDRMSRLGGRTRCVVFGVGDSPNRDVVADVARAGNGRAFFVKDAAGVSAAVGGFRRYLAGN